MIHKFLDCWNIAEWQTSCASFPKDAESLYQITHYFSHGARVLILLVAASVSCLWMCDIVSLLELNGLSFPLPLQALAPCQELLQWITAPAVLCNVCVTWRQGSPGTWGNPYLPWLWENLHSICLEIEQYINHGKCEKASIDMLCYSKAINSSKPCHVSKYKVQTYLCAWLPWIVVMH